MATTCTGKFFIATDTRLTVTGLKDEDGNYLNSATVVGTISNEDGMPVLGGLAFTYKAGSDGQFDAILPASTDLEEGHNYVLKLTITANGRQLTVQVQRPAAYIRA